MGVGHIRSEDVGAQGDRRGGEDRTQEAEDQELGLGVEPLGDVRGDAVTERLEPQLHRLGEVLHQRRRLVRPEQLLELGREFVTLALGCADPATSL